MPVLSLPPPGRSGRAPSGPKCAEDGNTASAMSLGRLLRRASSKASDLLTLTPGGGGGSGPPSVLDGEIIYSKNNVCVHPPEGLQGLGEHHPGESGAGNVGSRAGRRRFGVQARGELADLSEVSKLLHHFPVCPNFPIWEAHQ